MNGVAVLSKDEQLSKTLLNNGFKQAKGRNRIFIEDSSYSIPFILEHITNNLWAMNLFNSSIIIYSSSRCHGDIFTYECDEVWKEDLDDFLEATHSKYLKRLYEKDIEDKNITNTNGGEIEEFCTLKIKNGSRLMTEIMSLVELSKDRKTSVEELPDYVENMIVVF